MRPKIVSKNGLLVITLAGFVLLSALLLMYFNPASSNPNNPAISQAEANMGLPVRITIPKISVDAAIESIGLTPQGAVDVPKEPANAAWYNLGPRPGESGNAIIVGHYGRWKNGKASVFDNLRQLVAGDKVYVQDDAGVIATFVVREQQRYEPDAIVPEVFIADDNQSYLNLITCEGVWSEIDQSYSKRLVVFTDKE